MARTFGEVLRGALTRRAPSTPGVYQGGGGLWANLFSTSGRRGETVQLGEVDRLSENYGWVGRAVTKRADDIGRLGVTVQTLKGGHWVDNLDHPLQKLMNQPTAFFTGHELRYVAEAHRALIGRAAWLVVCDHAGLPRELHPLMPHRLKAIGSSTDFIDHWEYSVPNGGGVYEFPNWDPQNSGQTLGVLEWHEPDPGNLYASTSAASMAFSTVSADNSMRAYQNWYYKNFTMPGVVIESQEQFPGVQLAREMREDWNEQHRGPLNAGRTMRLWGGAKLSNALPDFGKLGMGDLLKVTKDDILAHFGVPPQVIGQSGGTPLGSDAQKAAYAIYRDNLAPAAARLQGALDQLAARFGPKVRAVLQNPVQEDEDKQRERWMAQYEAGVLSRGELRGLLGYDADQFGDFYYVPSGVQIVKDLGDLQTFGTGAQGDPNAKNAQNDGEKDKKPGNSTENQAETTKKGLETEDSGQKERIKRVRGLWSAEYADIKRSSGELDVELLDERWQRELPELIHWVRAYRDQALRNAVDLPTAYEALKAEARSLVNRSVT